MLARQGNRRAYGPDSRDAARLVGEVAAILSFGAGVLHISAAGDHTHLPVLFAGFVAVAVLQIALGVLLLRRPPSRLIIAAAVLMTLSSIGIWLVSRTAGLPFIEDGHLEQVGFKDGITKLLEITSIPLLLLLLSRDLARVSLPSVRLGGRTRAVVGTACLALLVPALLLGEGPEHSHNQTVAHDEHGGLGTVTHAGSAAHTDGNHAGAEHAQHASGGGHTHAAGVTDGGHSGVHFASAPLSGTHEHGATDTTGHSRTHRADQHGEARHDGGTHPHHEGGKHHGGNHGHNHDHGGGDESPEAEPAVSVSYEPAPRVCITSICFP